MTSGIIKNKYQSVLVKGEHIKERYKSYFNKVFNRNDI